MFRVKTFEADMAFFEALSFFDERDGAFLFWILDFGFWIEEQHNSSIRSRRGHNNSRVLLRVCEGSGNSFRRC
jgi:hypothetical protein